MYKCPECGSDALEVTIETWARLIQHEDGCETDTDEAQHHDHEWSENSVMRCVECGHDAIAEEFEVEDGTCNKCGADGVSLNISGACEGGCEDNEPRYECQNCGRMHTEEELKPLQNAEQRVARGEVMPAGECCECGSACHEAEEADAGKGCTCDNRSWYGPEHDSACDFAGEERA